MIYPNSLSRPSASGRFWLGVAEMTRELDSRFSDGIAVRVWWDPGHGRAPVTVRDAKTGQASRCRPVRERWTCSTTCTHSPPGAGSTRPGTGTRSPRTQPPEDTAGLALARGRRCVRSWAGSRRRGCGYCGRRPDRSAATPNRGSRVGFRKASIPAI
jgi:hypothetical protein